jgi:arylformamidase
VSASSALPTGPEGLSTGAWIDVTRELVAGHPNWPGDTPLSLAQTARIADGASVNVMALHTSTHTGTHLDAPYHYDDDGGRLASVPLADLMGPCLVLDASGAVGGDTPVDTDALTAALARVAAGAVPPRVLIKTGQGDTWTAFPEAFRPLTPALVAEASRLGVRLLGTDAPSVDALRSTDLPSHAACAAHGVWIVEGLALARVPEGRYEMLCLPLRLRDADASPVRALLRPSA